MKLRCLAADGVVAAGGPAALAQAPPAPPPLKLPAGIKVRVWTYSMGGQRIEGTLLSADSSAVNSPREPGPVLRQGDLPLLRCPMRHAPPSRARSIFAAVLVVATVLSAACATTRYTQSRLQTAPPEAEGRGRGRPSPSRSRAVKVRVEEPRPGAPGCASRSSGCGSCSIRGSSATRSTRGRSCCAGRTGASGSGRPAATGRSTRRPASTSPSTWWSSPRRGWSSCSAASPAGRSPSSGNAASRPAPRHLHRQAVLA